MTHHKALSMRERVEFRRWARVNYPPFSFIDGTWHPVVQAECVKINEEACLQLAADEIHEAAGLGVEGNAE